MAATKYQVRQGFVVVHRVARTDGTYVERTYSEGDEVALEDADFALHAHKLEPAAGRQRAAQPSAAA